MSAMTTDEILTQLRDHGRRVPREALAEVVRRREEFVPLLIAEIEKATELADEADPNDSLAFFAAYLLAELRESRALEPILAWFALDETTEENLFGDIITSNGAAILAAVGHDNPARLREYLRRDGLSPWVRGAALEALVRQVLWGDQSRESVVQFFSELLETNAFGKDIEAWTMLVGACMDLHPGEMLDGIRRLYERQVVDLFINGDFDDVEREAAEDLEAHLRSYAERYPPITDTARAVSWWQCFERPRPSRRRLGAGTFEPLPESSFGDDLEVPGTTIRHEQPKIGRNDLCPCGSGKKYKKCCLPPG
jgi:hypothetical protein